MLHLDFLELRLDTLIVRFYLMMALVLAGGFAGQWWIATLALPVFLSAMLGVRFSWRKPDTTIIKKLRLQKPAKQKQAG